ncbi:MAG TPA: metallophosphoesterase [Actinomycetota bacterium]
MARFTIYFATDIHGSEACFRKFLNAGAFYGVDAVILGGDVAGKGLIPLTRGADGSWEATLFGKPVRLGDEEALTEFERRMRLQGYYPYRTTPDEVVELGRHGEALDRAFEEAIGRSVEDWVGLADEKLKAAGIPCLVMPGNDDPPLVKRAMNEATWLTQAEDRIVELGPYQVLSLGYSTPTPWDSPREITDDEMRGKLAQLTARLEPNRPVLFNVHNPPFDTGTDRAYELTPDMRIKTAGGQPTLAPVGSVAVRAAIEEVQPVLALHGHIHESRAMSAIGRTKVCNPGSVYTEGALQGVIVSLDRDRVRSHKFVTG